MIEIIPCDPERHWEQIWTFMAGVFAKGESYPIAMDISEAGARAYWLAADKETFVAVDDTGTVQGSYYIRPNQPTLGAHICNCGYIVDPEVRGQGIASKMCEHSQNHGRAVGYRGMQYNLVVSTNGGAVRLWQRHGFEILGTVPGGFHREASDYVDAYIMFKSLV